MTVPAAPQRRREYCGRALFSYGFRPFFLAAALWAMISLPLWLHQFYGDIVLPTHFAPLDWHVHEMLFGYVAAAVAGFLLTAIPNWTGRLPVNGWPLAGLTALWLMGRVAIFFSGRIGNALAAAIDLSFLLVLAAVAAREIIAGRNWRNLRVLGVVGVLALGNIVFHAEVLVRGTANYGSRIALTAVILLISLIGGRIVPSFTHNWLARNNPGRLPVPFSRYDMFAIIAGFIALLAWIVAPGDLICGGLLLLAGLIHTGRLARWAGDRTLANRLVLAARRLRVRAARLPAGRPVHIHACDPADRRHSCLDCGGHRPHDCRRDDTCHAWPRRPAAARQHCDAAHLCPDLRFRDFADHRRVHRFVQLDRRCRHLLALGLRAILACLWTVVNPAKTGLGGRALLSAG